VLLLAASALGDRFGRRRVFTLGIAIFTAGSAACALAPSAGALIAARVVQGAGGAIITPLSLTLLATATPPQRRGAVIGAWGAIAGGAASLGPVLGGALTTAISWHWIFWINVPIGIVLIPLARTRLDESYGPTRRLDLFGMLLSGTGLLACVWGLIETGSYGWSSSRVLEPLAAGAVVLFCFVIWEMSAPAPMLPMRFFSARSFSVPAAASLLSYFSFLGCLFLVAQLLQVGLSASPVRAGFELLALTCAAVVTAPAAGALCDRVGPRPMMVGALALEAVGLAWLAIAAGPGVGYGELAPALVVLGVALACMFTPAQSALLAAVAPNEQGQASGVATVIRELGGVLGVAVLGGIFASAGSVGSPDAFLAGFRPAAGTAAAIAAAGALVALGLPRAERASRAPLPLQATIVGEET
jgi:EmrB/QacA subfamily drug resistance transporter